MSEAGAEQGNLPDAIQGLASLSNDLLKYLFDMIWNTGDPSTRIQDMKNFGLTCKKYNAVYRASLPRLRLKHILGLYVEKRNSLQADLSNLLDLCFVVALYPDNSLKLEKKLEVLQALHQFFKTKIEHSERYNPIRSLLSSTLDWPTAAHEQQDDQNSNVIDIDRKLALLALVQQYNVVCKPNSRILLGLEGNIIEERTKTGWDESTMDEIDGAVLINALHAKLQSLEESLNTIIRSTTKQGGFKTCRGRVRSPHNVELYEDSLIISEFFLGHIEFQKKVTADRNTPSYDLLRISRMVEIFGGGRDPLAKMPRYTRRMEYQCASFFRPAWLADIAFVSFVFIASVISKALINVFSSGVNEDEFLGCMFNPVCMIDFPHVIISIINLLAVAYYLTRGVNNFIILPCSPARVSHHAQNVMGSISQGAQHLSQRAQTFLSSCHPSPLQRRNGENSEVDETSPLIQPIDPTTGETPETDLKALEEGKGKGKGKGKAELLYNAQSPE